MAALMVLLACARAPEPVTVPSERGPAMVKIAGGPVRLGMKHTPPVAGFSPPTGPPPGMQGAPDLGAGNPVPAGKPVPDPLDPRNTEVSTFWIDVTEVTQAQYGAFLADTGYRVPTVDEPWAAEGWNWEDTTPPKPDHPVVLVNRWDADAFCEWAKKRLPTEAEWQLAALGPEERLFPWGNEYDGDKLNHGSLDDPFVDDSDGYAWTSPVGSFPAGRTPEGVDDMFGNAWEWTADVRVKSWDEILGNRQGDRLIDPHTSGVGIYAAVRGGAYFFDFRPNPAGERSAFILELRRKTSGFRCVRDA